MGEVIAIASQKGGVGKTTTAVNLSASLALLNHKTLLIDTDPQGHVASSFGFGKFDVKAGVYDLFLGNAKITDMIHKTEIENFDFIPTNIWADNGKNEQLISAASESILCESIKEIRDSYRFILIDCPPALGNLTLNALLAADSLIVPVQCEYYALKTLGKFLKLIQTIRQRQNPALQYRGFLLTMVDLRNNLTREVIKKIKYTLKGLVYETMIPRNVRLAEVPFYGRPAILFDKKSKGASSYFKLAKEVIQQQPDLSSSLKSDLNQKEHSLNQLATLHAS
ncbi:ParA family protein [candidate division KSB1 bacterium]|nr:ParA family protein [candidate division KSB1 bacterium]